MRSAHKRKDNSFEYKNEEIFTPRRVTFLVVNPKLRRNSGQLLNPAPALP